MFRAAKKNRVYEDVVEQIQAAIISGKLKVGERLPAERELKELLQTSRGTLREALRVLEQKGLIEIKVGVSGGAVVKSVSSEQVSASLDLLIQSQNLSLGYIAEFREELEGSAARLAALRIKEKDKKNLLGLLNKARLCVDKGIEFTQDFLTVDKEIHLCFAGITGNPLYISIMKTIHDNLGRYYDRFLIIKNESEMLEIYLDLEQVVFSLMDGNGPRASELIRAHVRKFNDYMEVQERQVREQ